MEEYRILIVEDEKTIAEAVRSRLAMWGLAAETVTDFRNVMADFERVRPHLVLMDISLPFMNGYHWCTEIRKASSGMSVDSYRVRYEGGKEVSREFLYTDIYKEKARQVYVGIQERPKD